MTDTITLDGDDRAAALEAAIDDRGVDGRTGAVDPATEDCHGDPDEQWTPLVVTFLCNWCSYGGAESAGGSRASVPSAILPVRVLCSSRVDYDLVATALAAGADGVLVLGCHPGDCHYRTGNYQTLRRHEIATPTFEGLGVDPDRVQLDWVSADEGERYAAIAREMVATVRDLGPVPREGQT
ncbi:MAG: hydrogenase iron-sulfur subunit [Halococcoides sp.]